MSVLGEGKLRLDHEQLRAANAAGWSIACWVGFEGKAYAQLLHARTGRVRTALYVSRVATA